MPGLGLGGFPWVVSLHGMLLVPRLWACLLGIFGCLCLGCGQGSWFCQSFSRGWACCYMVGLIVACIKGLFLVVP